MKGLLVVTVLAMGVCGSPVEPTVTDLRSECLQARKTGIEPGFSCHGFESYTINGIAICRYDAKGNLIPGFDGTDDRYCATTQEQP